MTFDRFPTHNWCCVAERCCCIAPHPHSAILLPNEKQPCCLKLRQIRSFVLKFSRHTLTLYSGVPQWRINVSLVLCCCNTVSAPNGQKLSRNVGPLNARVQRLSKWNCLPSMHSSSSLLSCNHAGIIPTSQLSPREALSSTLLSPNKRPRKIPTKSPLKKHLL